MLKYVAALLSVVLVSWSVQAQATAISPDGKLQAVAKGATVTVVDGSTGKELLAIKSHADDVTGIAFSPDGRGAASPSSWITATRSGGRAPVSDHPRLRNPRPCRARRPGRCVPGPAPEAQPHCRPEGVAPGPARGGETAAGPLPP